MRVRPFKALQPNPDWFRGLIRSGKHQLVQSFLEPPGDQALSMTRLEKNRESLETLVSNGSYIPSLQNAFYVYEQQGETGSVFGIWTLTSLDDLHEGKVMPHEQTLSLQRERLRLYRMVVGIEATPVVLTYKREQEICRIIEEVTFHKPDFEFEHAGSRHRLWGVSDAPRLLRMMAAFKNINTVCIADGHHRIQAAKALHQAAPQWISSFYISSGQLSCNPFHRVITTGQEINTGHLLNCLRDNFLVSAVKEMDLYKPKQPGQLGLWLNGKWYRLDRKNHIGKLYPDVSLLQEHVLAPFFGITAPATDQRLQCWSDGELEGRIDLATTQADTAIFTLYPLPVDQLIETAMRGSFLPPKSTFVKPRLPYGMLIYQNQTQALCASLK